LPELHSQCGLGHGSGCVSGCDCGFDSGSGFDGGRGGVASGGAATRLVCVARVCRWSSHCDTPNRCVRSTWVATGPGDFHDRPGLSCQLLPSKGAGGRPSQGGRTTGCPGLDARHSGYRAAVLAWHGSLLRGASRRQALAFSDLQSSGGRHDHDHRGPKAIVASVSPPSQMETAVPAPQEPSLARCVATKDPSGLHRVFRPAACPRSCGQDRRTESFLRRPGVVSHKCSIHPRCRQTAAESSLGEALDSDRT